MRLGTGECKLPGEMYELMDFKPPCEESLQRLRAIINAAFGRDGKQV
jgi:hypothetical protein